MSSPPSPRTLEGLVAEEWGDAAAERSDVMVLLEPYREHVQYLLDEFDDETQSWRDYCACIWGWGRGPYGGEGAIPRTTQEAIRELVLGKVAPLMPGDAVKFNAGPSIRDGTFAAYVPAGQSLRHVVANATSLPQVDKVADRISQGRALVVEDDRTWVLPPTFVWAAVAQPARVFDACEALALHCRETGHSGRSDGDAAHCGVCSASWRRTSKRDWVEGHPQHVEAVERLLAILRRCVELGAPIDEQDRLRLLAANAAAIDVLRGVTLTVFGAVIDDRVDESWRTVAFTFGSLSNV